MLSTATSLAHRNVKYTRGVVSGVCGRTPSSRGRSTDSSSGSRIGCSTANLTRAAAPPTSNTASSTSNHITTLYRKYDRLLPDPRPRQGRLALRTSNPPTPDPFGTSMRRIRDGRAALQICLRWEPEYEEQIADMMRSTARHGCPRHDVRRHLPPRRRQLQGCPAVSSHQGLQQGRGGLHPVRLRYKITSAIARARAR